MTVTEAAPSAPVGARGSTLPGRIWWTVAAVVLVGAVVLLYALVGRRTVQAHSLLPYFDVNESGPLQVGATMVVGGDVQPLRAKSGHRVLDVRAVVPDITVNRAHASVRIWECTLADSHSGIGMGYLSDATKTCAKFHPFRPGPVDLGFPATEIIFVVTAEHPGLIRVEGADVTYADGALPGRQHVGAGFVIRVKQSN